VISLVFNGVIWFVYWNMKDLLYAGPPPMLTASPVGLTYFICILSVGGVALAAKQKGLTKFERICFGLGLAWLSVVVLVFFLASFVLLFPSPMLPFSAPRDVMDGLFLFGFVGFWIFIFAGVFHVLFA